MKHMISVMILAMMVLIAGCSPDNAEPKETSDSVNTVEDNAAGAQSADETNAEAEVNTGSEGTEQQKERTMKFCSGGKEVMHTYYISDNAVYKKEVVKANNGFVLQISTKERECVKMEEGKPFNCVEHTEAEFEDIKEAALETADSDLGRIMGITCKEVPYDESVFATE